MNQTAPPSQFDRRHTARIDKRPHQTTRTARQSLSPRLKLFQPRPVHVGTASRERMKMKRNCLRPIGDVIMVERIDDKSRWQVTLGTLAAIAMMCGCASDASNDTPGRDMGDNGEPLYVLKA